MRCHRSVVATVFRPEDFDENEAVLQVARDYKLDVITIISQHEHWLPLCLPVVIDSQNQIHRVVNQPLSSEYSITSGLLF